MPLKGDPPFCERCSNTGWCEVPNPDGRGTCLERCGADCVYRAWRYGLAPGVPVEETGSVLDNFTMTPDNQDAIKHARLFVDGLHPGLYLWGGVGTGKTRLACSILNQMLKAGHQVRFKRVPELLIKLQAGVDDDELTSPYNQAIYTPVVALDDVGANQGTDFARRMLQTIYDGRLDRGLKTIWTSNLNLDELAEFLSDERLPSRIMGECKVVQLTGTDWRLRKRKRKTARTSKPAAAPPERRDWHDRED